MTHHKPIAFAPKRRPVAGARLALFAAALTLGACAAVPRGADVGAGTTTPAPVTRASPPPAEARPAARLVLVPEDQRPSARVARGDAALGDVLVTNVATNLSLPQSALNYALQGDLLAAAEQSTRFLVNSTLGLGGLFSPVQEAGLPPPRLTGFGDTLGVYGVPSGRSYALPLAGATSQRDLAGLAVDFVTDPLSGAIAAPQRYYGTAAKLWVRARGPRR